MLCFYIFIYDCCFLEGQSASDMHFQAYLLEGLARWNQDRAEASVSSSATVLRCYNQSLLNAVNALGEKVMGYKVEPNFRAPGKYTGEFL